MSVGRTQRSMVAVLLVWVGVACSSAPPPALPPATFDSGTVNTQPCSPYTVSTCACDDGAQGVKSCSGQGTYSACDCSPIDAGPAEDIVVTDVTTLDIPVTDGASGDASSGCGAMLSPCGTEARCVNLATDPNNCGMCGHVCALPNVMDNGCAFGFCTVIECTASYGDCDGVAFNGCETRLGSNTHCASCDDNCALQTETCCDECGGMSYCH